MKIPIFGYYIRMKNCPICKSIAKPRFEDYISKDKKVVPDVATYICTNLDCAHTWLPLDEENRIDKALGIKKCGICKRRLNTRSPLSKDCGGDCLKCMAEAGDLYAKKELREIKKEANCPKCGSKGLIRPRGMTTSKEDSYLCTNKDCLNKWEMK